MINYFINYITYSVAVVVGPVVPSTNADLHVCIPGELSDIVVFVGNILRINS